MKHNINSTTLFWKIDICCYTSPQRGTGYTQQYKSARKIIKIADSSEFGWRTIDQLVSYSDEKLMYKAKMRTGKKFEKKK